MAARLAAAVVVLGVVLAVGYLLFRPVTRAEAGMAPDFRLPTDDGLQVALSRYRGHPVLLNFFATWCAPCKAELPVIAHAKQTHRDLVTLLVDEREPSSQVRGFLRGLGVSVPALLDSDGTVAARYGIFAQPQTVWIDRAGHIRAISRGPVDAWVIDSRYRQFISNT